jgi:hypothetical protein
MQRYNATQDGLKQHVSSLQIVLTMPLRVRSNFKVSVARARAGVLKN